LLSDNRKGSPKFEFATYKKVKMKKLLTLFTLLSVCTIATSQVNKFELHKFVKNQETPFIAADGETFVINGTSWERAYGEKEYVLTPLMDNINEYNTRIKQLDNSVNGIIKSNFYFIKVNITSKSISTLKSMGIEVPKYIQNEVNVYLPKIDIEKLSHKNIVFSYLNNYGNKKVKIVSDVNEKATVTLFSDDFEVNPITTQFSVQNGSVNCGWKDISCNDHNGSWSLWCAADGAACNANCSDYASSMDAQFWSTNFINTTGYSDIKVNFWMSSDMNNTGTNDELKRYYDTGSGWQLSSFSYNSTHSDDGLGWRYRTFTLTGTITQYAFLFQFISNSFGNSGGVFIDEIKVTGNNTVGLDEMAISNSISIYPNPSNGIFTVEGEEIKSFSITNISGQAVLAQNVKHKTIQFDLSNQPKGLYFIKLITNNGIGIKKIIIE